MLGNAGLESGRVLSVPLFSLSLSLPWCSAPSCCVGLPPQDRRQHGDTAIMTDNLPPFCVSPPVPVSVSPTERISSSFTPERQKRQRVYFDAGKKCPHDDDDDDDDAPIGAPTDSSIFPGTSIDPAPANAVAGAAFLRSDAGEEVFPGRAGLASRIIFSLGARRCAAPLDRKRLLPLPPLFSAPAKKKRYGITFFRLVLPQLTREPCYCSCLCLLRHM